MKRFGDEKAGFSAAYEAMAGVIRVRAWGFWSAEVSAAFEPAVTEVCKSSPKGLPLQLEMAALKPLREEGQRSFGALIRALPGLGTGRVTISTASQLTKLQLLRLVAEHGSTQSIDFTSAGADSSPPVVRDGP